MDGLFHEEAKESKQFQLYQKVTTITIGDFEFPLSVPEKKYQTLIIGTMHIPVKVT